MQKIDEKALILKYIRLTVIISNLLKQKYANIYDNFDLPIMTVSNYQNSSYDATVKQARTEKGLIPTIPDDN